MLNPPYPQFDPPDFSSLPLTQSSAVRIESVKKDGVAPTGLHATSNYPEYVHLGYGKWILVRESRMDCAIVLKGETRLPRMTWKRAISEQGWDRIFIPSPSFLVTSHHIP